MLEVSGQLSVVSRQSSVVRGSVVSSQVSVVSVGGSMVSRQLLGVSGYGVSTLLSSEMQLTTDY